MRHYIYALVDPDNYKVRYVGMTRQRIDSRLKHHIGAAQRGKRGPVYDWLRSLLPKTPHVVCLEICEGTVRGNLGATSWRDAAVPAEVKWIKRFRRDVLNDLTAEQSKRDWGALVNRT